MLEAQMYGVPRYPMVRLSSFLHKADREKLRGKD